MPELPIQRVVALDLQQPADESAIAELLPAERWRLEFLKLSDLLSPVALEAARDENTVDFALAAIAIDELARAARTQPDDGHPVHWYVWGRAPLPLFAHLGHELSAWASPVASPART